MYSSARNIIPDCRLNSVKISLNGAGTDVVTMLLRETGRGSAPLLAWSLNVTAFQIQTMKTLEQNLVYFYQSAKRYDKAGTIRNR